MALSNRWKFDEGTGKTAADSASSHNGTLAGNANWVLDRPGAGALTLNNPGTSSLKSHLPGAGVWTVQILCWGGGGGGSRSDKTGMATALGSGGAGGGGAAFAMSRPFNYTVVGDGSELVCAITVGAAGTGGSDGDAASGDAGGDSSVVLDGVTLALAKGGGGSASPSAAGVGGSGAGSIGLVTNNGAGGATSGTVTGGGGGGGSGGRAGAASAALVNRRGRGGAGITVGNPSTGLPEVFYQGADGGNGGPLLGINGIQSLPQIGGGGGGGGSVSPLGVAMINGSDGGDGKVIVTWSKGPQA